MAKAIDLTGQKFGKLTVIKRGDNIGRESGWLCKCNCGNPELKLIRSHHLRYGFTESCGCLQKEHRQNFGKSNRKHFGCMFCGSEKHFAKGMCHACYERTRRQKIRYANERKGA